MIQLKFYPEKKKKNKINIINSLSFGLKKNKRRLKKITKKNHFVRLA